MRSTPMTPEPSSGGAAPPLLTVDGLRVAFAEHRRPAKEVVHGISFSLQERSSLAIVGESGSGKSVSMRGILGLLPRTARVSGSAQLHDGENTVELISARPQRIRRLLGRRVGMVFQNAMQALNPTMTLRTQLTEPLLAHRLCTRTEANDRAVQALADVGFPDPEVRINSYAFQLSGGMRQRAMIAAATIAQPDLVIADEPTTALDVTVQKQILDLLARLRDAGTTLIMITHDLGVARYLCEDALVLKDGAVRETGPTRQLLDEPSDDYTANLVSSSLEVVTGPTDEPAGTGAGSAEGALPAVGTTAEPVRDESEQFDTATKVTAAALRVTGLRKVFRTGGREVVAVDDVSFSLPAGRTLGIVGESGSGKSTVARMVMQLITPTSGDVEVDGVPVASYTRKQSQHARRHLQMVFQNPFGSLLPHFTIRDNIIEPFKVNGMGDRASRQHRASELLDLVGIPRDHLDAYPRQLSGGQQQRVAVARALALEPSLLVCDEPTSSLDATVQIQVLEVLSELQERLRFSVLLITHNLAVVQQMADDVAVMRRGRIVEHRPAAELFRDPAHDYTRQLLDAVLPVRFDRDGTGTAA